MNLVFLGAAASGKGTQAKKIEAEFGLVQVSTGDLLREAVRAETPLGRIADPLMKQGNLVPDDLVIGIIEERLKQGDLGGGVLFDGFPRTGPQAIALDEMLIRNALPLTKVLSLEVPESVLLERVLGRRSCPTCGAVYHLKAAPPKREGLCDHDGAALVVRSDDNEEKLKNRLAGFRLEIPKVKAHYAAAKLLAEIDGQGAPDVVYARIQAVIR